MIRVGCCGFPVSRKRYYKALDLVEVQLTFYSFPKEETLEGWRKEAPENFEFTIKASQFFTHPPSSPTYRRLKRPLTDEERNSVGSFKLNSVTKKAWEKTRIYLEILRGDKVLFQTPASFNATKENLENFFNFFSNIDREELKIVFEPRSDDWFNYIGEINNMGIFLALDPTEKNPLNQEFHYFRIHGGKGYKHNYTREELKELAKKLLSLEGEIYVLFNNIHMFKNSIDFKKIIKREGDG